MSKEIASVHNKTIQAIRALQKASNRRESGLFLVEGSKMVYEAQSLGFCRTLIVQKDRLSEYERAAKIAEHSGCDVLLVTQSVMLAISEAKTPQGIACTASIPAEPSALHGDLLIALDGVQDPGNVGTILRTADAAGFDGMLLSGTCADLYSAKSLRATMGSIFRVPVRRVGHLADELYSMKERGMEIIVSTLYGADFYAQCPGRRAVLVVGSEGQGVSAEVEAAATCCLKLPMRGGAQSLNAAVAAGIMMYEMARKRRMDND